MASSVPTRFCTDYAKRVSKCQKCKMQLEKEILRMGKIIPNFFVAAKDPSKPPPDMKQYFHKECLFEMLFKARPTTKVIDDVEEIEGFEDLNAEDQDAIKKLVDELTEKRSKDGPVEPKKTPAKKKTEDSEETPSRKRKIDETVKSKRPTEFNEDSDFNSFYKFIKICSVIKEIDSKSEKSAVITSLLQKKGFDGDLMLWLTFLIRDSDKRNYNVSDEKLVEYFAKILDMDEAKIQKYVTKSRDVALSIGHALEKKVTNEKSGWSLQKVERFLEKLSTLEGDEEIAKHLKFAAKRFRHDELEVLIRLIRKELDTGADASVILKGVHSMAPNVYESDGLDKVVDKYYNNQFEEPKKASASKTKPQEPKSKKSRRQQDSDESDAEESEEEMSDSESEDGHGSDSDTGDEEEISGSDSDDVSEISSDDEEADTKENSPKKVARGTRTRPRGGDGSIVKKEECPPDMEACRYGEKCYRKNEDHLERFWHPSSH